MSSLHSLKGQKEISGGYKSRYKARGANRAPRGWQKNTDDMKEWQGKKNRGRPGDKVSSSTYLQFIIQVMRVYTVRADWA